MKSATQPMRWFYLMGLVCLTLFSCQISMGGGPGLLPTDTSLPPPTETPKLTDTPLPPPTEISTSTKEPLPPTSTPLPPTEVLPPTSTPLPTDTPLPTASPQPSPTQTGTIELPLSPTPSITPEMEPTSTTTLTQVATATGTSEIIIPLPPTEVTSFGTLEVIYPEILIVDRVETVIVSLQPLIELAYLQSGPIYSPSPSIVVVRSTSYPTAGTVKEYNITIKLYPFMSAELLSTSDDILSIQGEVENWRRIIKGVPIIWSWSVTAHKDGEQKLILKLFGASDLVAGKPLAGEKYLVQHIESILNIEKRPISERVEDWLVTNASLIIGTTGPIALIILVVSTIIAIKQYQILNEPKTKNDQNGNS